MPRRRDNVIPGTVNMLALKALSWGPLHGYAISKWIQQKTEHALQVEEGVLYPALHKLERDGLVTADWGVNDTGRRAKFYTLSEKGRRHLRDEIARWNRTSNAVSTALAARKA